MFTERMEFKLIIKKLNNTLLQNEETVFDKWHQESSKHKKYFEWVKKNYKEDNLDIDIEQAWKSLEVKINIPKKKIQFWKYAVAASIAILISITFFFSKNPSSISEPTIVNNSIDIGTDKATLTLEDGTYINLEKGQKHVADNFSSNGEEIIYKASSTSNPEIVYNYLTIPRGGQYFIKLSDGTQVWLNSESKLKYPTSFVDGETRNVELVYGEAYFDVSPSTNHNGSKFKVFSGIQQVEVLGTEFNIKAYKDENLIHTTLVEGKVAINTANNHKEILKPNEKSILNKSSKDIFIIEVDVFSETAWKKGLFSFKEKSLKEIMKVLSRWYDVNVVFENKELEDVQFKGVINKNQNIEEILTLIKQTNFINTYDIKNNEIVIN